MARRPSRPLRKAPRVSEDTLHLQVAEFLERAWPKHLPYTHFPAGEKREKVERTGRDGRTYWFSPAGAKLKKMGLQPGWPDFIFILPNGQAAFIELKAKDGDLSGEQEDFREAVMALRCGHAVVRSLDELEQTLSRWLALFGLQLRARSYTPPPLLAGAV